MSTRAHSQGHTSACGLSGSRAGDDPTPLPRGAYYFLLGASNQRDSAPCSLAERGGVGALPLLCGRSRAHGSVRGARRLLRVTHGGPARSARATGVLARGARAAGLSGLGTTSHHLRPLSSTNAGVGSTRTLLGGSGGVVRLAMLCYARAHGRRARRGALSYPDPILQPLLAHAVGEHVEVHERNSYQVEGDREPVGCGVVGR